MTNPSSPTAPAPVDVVIVSWNVRDELLDCLGSVAASRGVAPRTVVVDNASSDGSADAVATRFPDVRLIRNRANLGFARAANQGIAAGTAPSVLLLNPDTIVPPEGIASLVSRLASLPDHGMIVPRLTDSRGRVESSAYLFPSLRIALLVALGCHRLASRSQQERMLIPGRWGSTERDVPWAIGAAMLVRRTAIERVGLLDESFFVYAEDMEWCDRMWSAGLGVRYTPAVTVIHHGNRSGEQRFGEGRTAEYMGSTTRYLLGRHGSLWTAAYLGINAATAASRVLLTAGTSRLRPTPRRLEVRRYWRDHARWYLTALVNLVRRPGAGWRAFDPAGPVADGRSPET